MSKLGEVIFKDGHVENILVVYEERHNFVRVLTRSGEYIYRECLIDVEDDLLDIRGAASYAIRSGYIFEKVLWGVKFREPVYQPVDIDSIIIFDEDEE